MTYILKNIKQRLLIIIGIIFLSLAFGLHWVFAIPGIISIIISVEANEFDFILNKKQ